VARVRRRCGRARARSRARAEAAAAAAANVRCSASRFFARRPLTLPSLARRYAPPAPPATSSGLAPITANDGWDDEPDLLGATAAGGGGGGGGWSDDEFGDDLLAPTPAPAPVMAAPTRAVPAAANNSSSMTMGGGGGDDFFSDFGVSNGAKKMTSMSLSGGTGAKGKMGLRVPAKKGGGGLVVKKAEKVAVKKLGAGASAGDDPFAGLQDGW
jgi:hypothetical protein